MSLPAAAAPKRLSRRALLAGAAGALVAADALVAEPRWLEVTEHEVPVAGLPRELAGYTIAQLTDVHLDALGALHDAVCAAVHAHAPDLVVLTGDVVDREDALPAVTELCARLAAPGRALLATLGNWEHWGAVPLDALARAYRRGGARLLGNEHVALARGLVLCATDDACSGHADLAAALAGLTPRAGRVLLTHAPGVLDVPGVSDAPRFDLALAGHTHGGQVRLGSFAPWVPPGSGRFVAGTYATPLGRAYVSRGLGTSLVPARLSCRPELPVFRLVAA